jgi:hypothetical protein
MKRFCLTVLLIGTFFTGQAGQVNNPNNPGYNLAAQTAGLISACMHKNVFNLLVASRCPYNNPNPKKIAKLTQALELLEKKCGVSIIKDRNTDAFFAPFNAKLYVKTYPHAFFEKAPYYPRGSKEELERIHISFGIVRSLLQTRLADDVFEGEEIEAAKFLIKLLKT